METATEFVGKQAVIFQNLQSCRQESAQEEEGLIRPKALVVLRHGEKASPTMSQQLMDYLGDNLAQYKLPRWIEFVDVLPGSQPITSPDHGEADGSVALEAPQEDADRAGSATGDATP